MTAAAAGVNVTGPGVVRRRVPGSKVDEACLLADDATCAAPPPRGPHAHFDEQEV